MVTARLCSGLRVANSISVKPSGRFRNWVSRSAFDVASAAVLILSTGFAHGQTAQFAGMQTVLGSDLASPHAVAVDASGNVFVADTGDNAVKEILAVNGSIPISPSIRVLGNGFSSPWSVAVDSSGNVFVADFGDNAIKEIEAVNGSVPDSPVIRTLVSVSAPVGVALDNSGNVYFTDTEYGSIKELLYSSGYATVITLATEFWDGTEWVFMHLGGLAVDSSGDVFATDSADNAVYEVVAVNGSIPSSPVIHQVVSGFSNPEGVAVDAGGDIFVADYNNNEVKEVLAVNGSIPSVPTVIPLGSGLHYPYGVAVDERGNVLIADTGNSRAIEEAMSGVSYGSISVGTTSNPLQFAFAFGTADTLGSIAVLTQGAAGLDFSNSGTGSCAANTAYSAGQTCTVNVSFTPMFSGSRNGAVELNDTNGNVIAIAYVQGTGVGPQLTFSPGTQTTLGSGFSFAAGVAMDGNGDAYVVDLINNVGNVQEIMAVNGNIPANPTIRTLIGGLDCPGGPALDAAGDVYYVDLCYHTVNEIQAVNGSIPSSPMIRTLTSQFTLPEGIAVDSRGDVYVLDGSNNTVNEIFAVNGNIPASPTITTLASGFAQLDGIAVDILGNIYVSDDKSRELFEIHAVNGMIPASPDISLLGSGFVIPRGIAVDALGNVYVAEYFYNTVYKLLAVNGSIPASPTIQNLGTGLLYANGVALDAKGSLFVADYGDARLVRLDYADPPSLNFASTPVGSTSADSPQTVTLENIGNAALTLPIPGSGNNPVITTNFTLDENATSACPVIGSGSSEQGTLAAGASCVLPISFAPASAGNVSGSLALTDDNSNATGPSYATQTISLSGTAISGTSTITWPAPAAITYGTALSAIQLSATANVPGTFAYSPAAGTVLTAGTQTLLVTFTPTDSTDYSTATSSVSLMVTKAMPVISWPTPGPITYGTGLSATQLSATANVPGTFAYSPAAGTVLSAGTQTLHLTFTPTDTTDYTTATSSVSLAVNKAAPVITWLTPAPIASGTPLGSTQLDATANVPGTFVYSPMAGTVLPVGSNILNVTFTPTDTADYTTTSASVTLVVNVPGFTLAASPASLSIMQGANASSTITVTPTGGFNDGVTLSATGLPKGVTAAFSANPTKTASTVTFAVSNGASLGTGIVTITGKSGTLTQTTSITVTVTRK